MFTGKETKSTISVNNIFDVIRIIMFIIGSEKDKTAEKNLKWI